jgi:hypothetical protein
MRWAIFANLQTWDWGVFKILLIPVGLALVLGVVSALFLLRDLDKRRPPF